LFFGEAFSKARHRLAAFADLVEELAIGDGAHVVGVDEAFGCGVVEQGFGAIAFAGIAVALGAFVQIDGSSGGEGSGRRLQRIFAELGFFGDFPFAIFVEGDGYRNANYCQKRGEKEFAEAEGSFRRRGHRSKFSHTAFEDKRKKKITQRTQRGTELLPAED
jgi:hypothetical protein